MLAALTTLLAVACGAPESGSVAAGGAGNAPAALTGSSPPSRSGTPELRVSTVAGGLDHVWDMGFLPDGRVLVTERDGRFALLSGAAEGATVSPVAADFGDLLARGEGGLMGMVVHPDFAQTRRFTTCQTHTEAGRAVSCQSSDLVVPIEGVNKPALLEVVAEAQPTGWTLSRELRSM